jgi:hypothetical protein
MVLQKKKPPEGGSFSVDGGLLRGDAVAVRGVFPRQNLRNFVCILDARAALVVAERMDHDEREICLRGSLFVSHDGS